MTAVIGLEAYALILAGLHALGGVRTDEAQLPAALLIRLRDLFPPSKLLTAFPPEEGKPTRVCLYGEGYGRGIQSMGRLYRPDGADFALFDVLVGDWWLKWDAVTDVALKLGCTRVPDLGVFPSLLAVVSRVKAGIVSAIAHGYQAEGVVVCPLVDLRTRAGERVMGKLKAKDFPAQAGSSANVGPNS